MFSLKGIRTVLPFRRLFHLEHCKLEKKLPDAWDLMTGKELFLATQYAKGNLDPFDSLPKKRGPGTKECPNIVYSFTNKRLVGCVCNSEVNHVVYFYVHEGFPRRCECNYWFVLEKVDPVKIYEDC